MRRLAGGSFTRPPPWEPSVDGNSGGEEAFWWGFGMERRERGSGWLVVDDAEDEERPVPSIPLAGARAPLSLSVQCRGCCCCFRYRCSAGRAAGALAGVEAWMTPAEFDLAARCDYKLPTVKCLAKSNWDGSWNEMQYFALFAARRQQQTRVVFSWQNFWRNDTVALSWLFGN